MSGGEVALSTWWMHCWPWGAIVTFLKDIVHTTSAVCAALNPVGEALQSLEICFKSDLVMQAAVLGRNMYMKI